MALGMKAQCTRRRRVCEQQVAAGIYETVEQCLQQEAPECLDKRTEKGVVEGDEERTA